MACVHQASINQSKFRCIVIAFWSRLQIARCWLAIDDATSAQKSMERVETGQRTAAMNMLLARLYRAKESTGLATECYKNVLRDNPYAVEAALALVDLEPTPAGSNGMPL